MPVPNPEAFAKAIKEYACTLVDIIHSDCEHAEGIVIETPGGEFRLECDDCGLRIVVDPRSMRQSVADNVLYSRQPCYPQAFPSSRDGADWLGLERAPSPLVTAGKVEFDPNMRGRLAVEDHWKRLYTLLNSKWPGGRVDKAEKQRRAAIRANRGRMMDELAVLEWVLGATDETPATSFLKVVRPPEVLA